MKNVIAVRTVGLRSYQQAQLKAQLARYPQIELKHFDDWRFGLLGADVLVIGVDTRPGQETLGMLKSFSGSKEPMVVSYSENDERVLLFLEHTPSETDSPARRKPDGFYPRLQEALRKVGATGLVLEDVSAPAVDTPTVEGGQASQGGIRWSG